MRAGRDRPLRSRLQHVLGRHHDVELTSSLQALLCGLHRHGRGVSHAGGREVGESRLAADSLGCGAPAIAEGVLDHSQREGRCGTWRHRGSGGPGALGGPVHTHLGHSLLPPAKAAVDTTLTAPAVSPWPSS